MYLTVKEVRAFSKNGFGELTDNKLLMLIKRYSGIIDDYCNTKFVPTTHNFVCDYHKTIKVMKTPLLHVETLTYLEHPLAENKDFFVYSEQNLIEMGLKINASRKRAIKVDYTYGFDEAPETVKFVLGQLIVLYYSNNEELNTTLQSENFDGEYSYQKGNKSFEDMFKEILSLLDKYVQKPYKPIVENNLVRVSVI